MSWDDFVTSVKERGNGAWRPVAGLPQDAITALPRQAANSGRSMDLARVREFMKRRKLAVGGACALVLVVGAAIAMRPASPDSVSRAAPPDLPAVVATPVRMTRLSPQTELAGTVVSLNDSQLASDVDGRVAWIADVGAIVKAGDVVVRLDQSLAAMQLASDRANVARLAAQLRYDRNQAQRMQNLFAQSAIAAATRDQAISTRDMDAAALAQANAALGKSRYTFDHSEIRAPFPGRVVSRLVNPGEYATAGKAVARLVDIGSLEVSAQAPIQYAQYLHDGMAVATVIEDKSVPATVRAVVPVGDQLSRTVEIRLAVGSGVAFVGDAAKVIIPSGAPHMALAVPRDALILREDSTYIFKLDRKNAAIRIAVSTGAMTGDLVEVTGALSPGERVIVRGAEHLETGQKVRVGTAT